MRDVEEAKMNAAKEALKYVEDAEVIGVGTGSTVAKFIDLLGRFRGDFKDRVYVASSIDTILKLSSLGFKVVDLTSISGLDVYVDGADEVDKDLNMVKGGGAALTMEKLLTYYSKARIFIVDYTKIVDWLGQKHPIPLDVLPQAVNMVCKLLEGRGYRVEPRPCRGGKFGPIISDVGGVIIDLYLKKPMEPEKLEHELKMIPGIIETGLFIGLADRVIVGFRDRVEILHRE